MPLQKTINPLKDISKRPTIIPQEIPNRCKANQTQVTLNRIETHEKECLIRYKNIEKRLEDGSKKFDKLETMLWAVYPFILASVVLSRFI